MKIIDITRCVQEAPIYPGSPPVLVVQTNDMSKGAPFNTSMITSGSHMGTHADATRHFIKESTVGIDQMELFRYYGSCRVLTVPSESMIATSDLEGRIDGCERLILHGGGNSFLTKEAADYIVSKGVVTLVTDAMSIGSMDNDTEIHRIILSQGIAVIENVILDGVNDGDYILSAFPIKIGGCDGAPVRAVLIKDA
jgi:arylformamidase